MEHLDIFRKGIEDFVPLVNCVHFGIGSEDSCFLSFDPFAILLWSCAWFAIYSFVWSIIGNNCSKVDQIWSITPWFYCWQLVYIFHLKTGKIHSRLALISVLVTLWGIRLSYNFWRRGGYGNLIHHEEDYRWPILRKKMHPFLFLIFNITFIAGYQNLLLMLIMTPVYYVMKQPDGIKTWDIGVSMLLIMFLVIETIADQQHYNFQTYKYQLSEEQRKSHPNEDIRNGFLTSGLFQFTRHPNYFAEQMIWVCVYLFTVNVNNGNLLNGTIIGPVLLILLFQGSIRFGESITALKYPKYIDYQQRTSQCFPWISASSKRSHNE